ncbi:HdeD family acid-resistance protein [Desulfoferrobacter suflitae]|uniref:HdeD family acid-resistance protein n=1 Tax=Desulfoferrobacter suflitae TaxID=2865782 RepID=UPI00216458F5|nr:HdeD family acid-resistance protein [Desulfoferrobacter suflitae]MCK8603426.1 HdeD family acid-resistance protein [Desulfoferrobacter suflitae]
MNDTISLKSASRVMREAMRQTIKRYSIWYVVQGGLMMLAGAFAFAYPILPSSAVPHLLGWLLIASGIVQGASLIGARDVPHFWVQLLSVLISVIIGLMFLRVPGDRLFVLTMLLIVYFITEGISKLILSLTIRPLPNWQWVLVSGLIAIVAAILTWSKLPVTAIWVLCPLFGIVLLSEGAAIGYLAWQVRNVSSS